jgi:hypothetical protein
MHIELRCPSCPGPFRAPHHLPADQVLPRMIDAGTCYALADGPTFQDMIRATLVQSGYVGCPECGQAVTIHEVRAAEPPPARCSGRVPAVR